MNTVIAIIGGSLVGVGVYVVARAYYARGLRYTVQARYVVFGNQSPWIDVCAEIQTAAHARSLLALLRRAGNASEYRVRAYRPRNPQPSVMSEAE